MNSFPSEEFSKYLKLEENEKIVLFNQGDYIGFSISKEYTNLKVLRNDGDNDLYCLIRIGYKSNAVSNENKLHIDISIQSKFQRDYHGNLFGDRKNKDYPDDESYMNFKGQMIPFNLKTSEKTKFIFKKKEGKFYKDKKEVTLRGIINELFRIHEESSSLLTQLIYKYPTIVLSFVFEWLIIKGLYKCIYKSIIQGPRIKDEDFIAINIHYGHTIRPELENQIESDENKTIPISDTRNFEVSLPLFGGKLRINKRGLLIGIIILGGLSIQYYSNQSCNNYIIKLLQFYKDNEVILGSLFILWIGVFHIIFEEILPRITLFIINIIIKIRKVLLESIYYKGYDYDTGNNPYS